MPQGDRPTWIPRGGSPRGTPHPGGAPRGFPHGGSPRGAPQGDPDPPGFPTRLFPSGKQILWGVRGSIYLSLCVPLGMMSDECKVKCSHLLFVSFRKLSEGPLWGLGPRNVNPRSCSRSSLGLGLLAMPVPNLLSKTKCYCINSISCACGMFQSNPQGMRWIEDRWIEDSPGIPQ